jgi:DNA repair protein RecN (Recombination protein N)
MLTTLRIKNLALVTELTLQLQPGFNAITGETGAGKSIIIGALNLVLGERADRTLIRSGEDSCSVEAVFDLPAPHPIVDRLLDENGLDPCAENQLLLKRVFTATGSNRQFINGSPATLQILSRLGQQLVDMHGPHEHQSLLHPARQLDILDSFAGLEPLRGQFAAQIAEKTTLESRKASLIVDERTYAQQLDLLGFQTEEIASARLQPGEEATLEQEFQRASNASKLLEHTQNALNLLSEDERSLIVQSGELGRWLQALQRLDPAANDLVASHEQAMTAWNDLQTALRHYADSVEVNPERLSELEERLNLLHGLKRKYGNTIEEVIAFGEQARQKLETLKQRDAELIKLNQDIEKCRKAIWHTGQELSAARKKAIPRLVKAAIKELQDLGFRQSHFDISVQTAQSPDAPQITASGLDSIEFLFAPNPGEPARPLRAIASSGEMSRVMLALKTVLAGEDAIPLLVFDEVDANVGGETARVVGEKMLQIARKHQLICITHLPAVAACATTHYVVAKRQAEGRTLSEIAPLGAKDRVHEIARMLGGQGDAIVQHAKALLKMGATKPH